MFGYGTGLQYGQQQKPFGFDDPEFWEAEGLPGIAELLRAGKEDPQAQPMIDAAVQVFRRVRRKRLRDRCIAMSLLLVFVIWALWSSYLALT